MTDLALNTSAAPDVNASTCQEVANILWQPEPYEDFESFRNTIAIRMAHTGVPRGGASNDILDVLMGSPEQVHDYRVGLLVASIIILLFFGAWIAMLLVFKWYFGTSKVGWLSGRRLPLPKKPTDQSGQVMENSYVCGNKEKERVSLTASQPPQDVSMKLNKKQRNQNQNPQDDMEPVGPNDDDQPSIDFEHDDAADMTADSHISTAPQTIEEWKELYHQKISQQRWLKAIVMVACLTIVSMAIIMANMGLQPLQESLNYSRNSIYYNQEIVNTAAHTVGGLALSLGTFQSDMQLMLYETNAICPNIQRFLCENLIDVDTCNTTGIFGSTEAGQELEEIFQELVQIFFQDWDIVTQFEEFELELIDLTDAAEIAQDKILAFDWVFYVALIFDVMVGFLAVAMIVFLLLPLCHQRLCLQCMHHQCLFPIFIILVLLSFIFAIAFLLTSLVSSDAYVDLDHYFCQSSDQLTNTMFSFFSLFARCADDPDQRLITIATHHLYDHRQPYIKEQVVHWLRREYSNNYFGCCSVGRCTFSLSHWIYCFLSCVCLFVCVCVTQKECKTPTTAIDQNERLLQDLYNNVVQFANDIIIVNDWLVENCGTTNTNVLLNMTESLLGNICVAIGIVWDMKDSFQCSTWMPLYYNTVYHELCYNGVNVVWDIAATQFLTCFMACVILTCRCVFFDLEITGEKEEDDDDDDNKQDKKNKKMVAGGAEQGYTGAVQVGVSVRVNLKGAKEEKIEKVVAKGHEEVVHPKLLEELSNSESRRKKKKKKQKTGKKKKKRTKKVIEEGTDEDVVTVHSNDERVDPVSVPRKKKKKKTTTAMKMKKKKGEKHAVAKADEEVHQEKAEEDLAWPVNVEMKEEDKPKVDDDGTLIEMSTP
jgi:hypothetical protein